MSRMHVYTVHINPSFAYPYEAAEFVEEGFSWPAFFFTFLWMLYKKLWLPTFFIIVFNIIMVNLVGSESFTTIGMMVLSLAAQILIGLFANDWYRAKLKRKGYIIADIVTGDSLIRAEQRFFDRYFSSHVSAQFVS